MLKKLPILSIALFCLFPPSLHSQEPSMSDLAETQMANQRILASLRVEEGVVKAHKGVKHYDKTTGWVTLKGNQNGVILVPIVSDLKIGRDYMTEKHFIRSVTATGKVRVWRTTLDTGARNQAPESFTLIVIGLSRG